MVTVLKMLKLVEFLIECQIIQEMHRLSPSRPCDVRIFSLPTKFSLSSNTQGFDDFSVVNMSKWPQASGGHENYVWNSVQASLLWLTYDFRNSLAFKTPCGSEQSFLYLRKITGLNPWAERKALTTGCNWPLGQDFGTCDGMSFTYVTV